jgi:hypothetical protein
MPIPEMVLVIGYTTVLRRWKNHKPEYKTEHPLDDPEILNNAIPIGEWELGLDGKPTPPWKLTYVVYFVDFKTGALFTYAHDTYGALLCYNALEEQIAVYRMLRGEQVWPIVRLEKRQWRSTTYGMQMRPHFRPVDWRATGNPLAAPQSPTPQLPGPTTTTAPAAAPTAAPAAAPAAPAAPPAAAPAAPTATPAAPPAAATPPASSASAVLDNTKAVKPITVAELVADEIPWK